MTTSTPTDSARNHFLDALRGIAALLATARAHQARLHTMDSDFQGLTDVVLIEKGI